MGTSTNGRQRPSLISRIGAWLAGTPAWATPAAQPPQSQTSPASRPIQSLTPPWPRPFIALAILGVAANLVLLAGNLLAFGFAMAFAGSPTPFLEKLLLGVVFFSPAVTIGLFVCNPVQRHLVLVTLAVLGNGVCFILGMMNVAAALRELSQEGFDELGLISLSVIALLLIPVLNFIGIISRLVYAQSRRIRNQGKIGGPYEVNDHASEANE